MNIHHNKTILQILKHAETTQHATETILKKVEKGLNEVKWTTDELNYNSTCVYEERSILVFLLIKEEGYVVLEFRDFRLGDDKLIGYLVIDTVNTLFGENVSTVLNEIDNETHYLKNNEISLNLSVNTLSV